MSMTKHKFIAYEGLIYRSSLSDLKFPFMLKGSFLTRQYFPEQIQRIPQDLDWVCLKPLNDATAMNTLLNQWLGQITRMQLNDGIEYEKIQDDHYWDAIDYAMSDDFPTVNTCLKAVVDGQTVNLNLDVSFNLDISDVQYNLEYRVDSGQHFNLAQTPSIAMQVAWKLHQTMVGARFKDIFDLTYLLQHEKIKNNRHALEATIYALEQECLRDSIDITKHFKNSGQLFNEAFFRLNELQLNNSWKITQTQLPTSDFRLIPHDFNVFWDDFIQALKHSGLLDFVE